MQKFMLYSKIHRARVTEANLDYEGSITVDEALMEKAHLLPYEMVQVYNISNGERFETYLINGERNSGVFCINGAAARKAHVGDQIIIASYVVMDEDQAATHHPHIVCLDSHNRVIEPKKYSAVSR